MKWSAALLLCLFTNSACTRESARSQERCVPTDAGTPVDPILLAFLSRARAAHHLADERENAGELAAAVAPLAELVEGPLPHSKSEQLAPEVREVLADTRARLADLRSRQGAFDLALADVHAGLESEHAPSYFRGHLLETEGLVEERRAKALQTTDGVASARAKERAISLLEQAMAVQAQVIQNAQPSASTVPPASP